MKKKKKERQIEKKPDFKENILSNWEYKQMFLIKYSKHIKNKEGLSMW